MFPVVVRCGQMLFETPLFPIHTLRRYQHVYTTVSNILFNSSAIVIRIKTVEEIYEHKCHNES